MQMKNPIILSILIVILSISCSCLPVNAPTETETTEVVRESERYVVKNCRYFVNEMPSLQTKPFSVICPNEEAFIYETDIISDTPAYDGMPVWAVCDDNGTPNYVKDDIVLGLVLDRETEIYDKLYDKFSENENWIVTRTGNNIHIDVIED